VVAGSPARETSVGAEVDDLVGQFVQGLFDAAWQDRALRTAIKNCPWRIRPEWVWPWEKRDLFWRASYQPALYLISRALKPGRILEIGYRAGYSAMALLGGSPEAQYVGMDNGGGEAESCAEMLEWAEWLVIGEYPTAKLLRCDSQARPWPQEVLDSGPYDLVFIDGCHERRAVARDLAATWGKMASGGTIVMHDLWHNSVVAGLADVLPVLRCSFSMRTFRLPHGGLILLRKERDPWTDPECREFDKL